MGLEDNPFLLGSVRSIFKGKQLAVIISGVGSSMSAVAIGGCVIMLWGLPGCVFRMWEVTGLNGCPLKRRAFGQLD